MTPEGKVKKRLTEGLEQLSAYWFFPATHGYGRSGVPDIIACIDGQFFGFECKADGNTTTALQERELEKIREAQGIGYVVKGEAMVELTLIAVENLIGRKRVRQPRTAAKSRGGAKATRLRAD